MLFERHEDNQSPELIADQMNQTGLVIWSAKRESILRVLFKVDYFSLVSYHQVAVKTFNVVALMSDKGLLNQFAPGYLILEV